MDLTQIPISNLSEEIMRRCESGIFLVVLPDQDTNEPVFWNWHGDFYRALGLCEEMKDIIKRDTENREKEIYD